MSIMLDTALSIVFDHFQSLEKSGAMPLDMIKAGRKLISIHAMKLYAEQSHYQRPQPGCTVAQLKYTLELISALKSIFQDNERVNRFMHEYTIDHLGYGISDYC